MMPVVTGGRGALGAGITKFKNCQLLRGHELVKDDLWVQGGKVINPEVLFFTNKCSPDLEVDCRGSILAPGFIDLQINGAFGVDFSNDVVDEATGKECVRKVAKGLLQHGVTSFCPTIITSPDNVYHQVLPHIPRSEGGPHGATVLGIHAEGPFISTQKKGMHPVQHIRSGLEGGLSSMEEVYGPGFSNIAIVTMAPELEGAQEVVKDLTSRGVAVSVGHTTAPLAVGEEAVRSGATLITHLFNAMTTFHHRDPGLTGLLTSEKLDGKRVWYGIIADGIHTHPAALRIAYKTNFESLVLVTDAIVPMGLDDGRYQFGQVNIEVRGMEAYVADTSTLCGSVVTMNKSIQKFKKEARCTSVEAIEAATLHPAQALGIEKKKGSLEFGCDADLVMLHPDDLEVLSTWIRGQCVYEEENKNNFCQN